MAVNGVEIKVGQKWKTCEGEIVEVVNFDQGSDWPWDLSNGASVTDSGLERIDGQRSMNDIVVLIENNEPKYTVREFYEALQNAVSSSRSDVEKYLANKHDPEYKEYVRLKAKFES